MNRYLYRTAFGVGLLAIGWVGAGHLRANALALTMTVLIAAFYLMGALELRRFDQATSALDRALGAIPQPLARLGDWLDQVPAALRNTVRLRIEGDRVALPGPALTPYLVGLLVLLGMLGTFLGMVVTLNGTGIALELATDVQTMRESLAAPIKGLGLAFGTSVAGVAASAMLGLMSALCRRQRLQTAQRLDTCIATALRPFTRTHQREAALQLQQQQAQLVPALVDQLQALMTQMATQARQSSEQLLASQDRFQGQAESAYRALAASVDQTLQRCLAEGARTAATTIQSVVQASMAGIAHDATAWHGQIAGTVAQQLTGVSAQVEQQSVALLRSLAQAQDDRQSALAARDEQRLAAWTAALAAMAATLQQQWQQTAAQTLGQQAQICTTLDQTAGRITAQAELHAQRTITEIARLVQTASEAPRAAAELVAQLREKLSDSLLRDQAMLDERSRLMATLNTLLGAMQHTASEQTTAIDQLITATTAGLAQAGARFTAQVDAESARMQATAAQLGASAVDVASLGEAFGAAVDLFSQSSGQLMSHLQRVDETLGKAITRSDDQLAYYVAQAREVIDLSLLSQKQIVDDLQRIGAGRAAQRSEV